MAIPDFPDHNELVRFKDLADAKKQLLTSAVRTQAELVRKVLADGKKTSPARASTLFSGNGISFSQAAAFCAVLFPDWNEQEWYLWLERDDGQDVSTPKGSDSNVSTDIPDGLDSLICQRTRRFVGRKEVFEAINQYFDHLQAENCGGYFTVVGDPGEGKSSILAWYVRYINTDAEAYFNPRNAGGYTAASFQEDICKRLIERFSLSKKVDVSDVSWDSGRILNGIFSLISKQLIENHERLVLVVDALDEVNISDHQPDNILYLPSDLPENIYVLMARRRMSDKELRNNKVELDYGNEYLYDLRERTENSQRDIAEYIDKCLNIKASEPRYEEFKYFSDKLYTWLNKHGVKAAELQQTLIARSAENFMYISLVTRAIAAGFYSDDTLTALPSGLNQYYKQHWRKMDVTPDQAFIVRLLCEFGDEASVDSWARLCRKETHEITYILQWWESFLHENISFDPPRYSFYHQTYIDFLQSDSMVKATSPLTKEQLNQKIVKGLIGDFKF